MPGTPSRRCRPQPRGCSRDNVSLRESRLKGSLDFFRFTTLEFPRTVGLAPAVIWRARKGFVWVAGGLN